MKSRLGSLFLKTALLIGPIVLASIGSTVAQAADKRVLSPGPVRPGHLDYRSALPQGYLIVYSATDEFDDGGVPYHAHSSYDIYTLTGKLFRKVENHISRSDEIPEIIALPVGSYTVDARSEKIGYVRRPIIIKAGRRTVLDLGLGEKETLGRVAHK